MVANYMFYNGQSAAYRQSKGHQITPRDHTIQRVADAMARDPQLVKAARNYVEAAKFYLVPMEVRVSYPLMLLTCPVDAVAGAFGTICEVGGLMPTYWRTNNPIPDALLEARNRIMNGSSRPTMPRGLRIKELRVLEEDLARSLSRYIGMPITSIERRLQEGGWRNGYMSQDGQLGISEIESALSVHYVHLIAKAAAADPNFKNQINWYVNDKRAATKDILNVFDPDVERKLGQGGNAIAVALGGRVNVTEQMSHIKPTETPLEKAAFAYALELSECYRSGARACPAPKRPGSYEENYAPPPVPWNAPPAWQK